MGAWLWTVRNAKPNGFWPVASILAGFATTANILIPTGTILGERLAYLPSAGFCLLLAAIWTRLFAATSEKRQQTLALALLVLVVAALGARAVARNRDWRSNLTLFAAAVRAAPGSAKAHSNLGSEYMAQRNWILLAPNSKPLCESIPIIPTRWLLTACWISGRATIQDAGRMMERALYTSGRDNPNYDFMAVNLAALWMQTGDDFDAMDLLNREIAESPSYARAWANRAAIRYRNGHAAAALSDAEAALRLDHNNRSGA